MCKKSRGTEEGALGPGNSAIVLLRTRVIGQTDNEEAGRRTTKGTRTPSGTGEPDRTKEGSCAKSFPTMDGAPP